jgi:hypothetical protein
MSEKPKSKKDKLQSLAGSLTSKNIRAPSLQEDPDEAAEPWPKSIYFVLMMAFVEGFIYLGLKCKIYSCEIFWRSLIEFLIYSFSFVVSLPNSSNANQIH